MRSKNYARSVVCSFSEAIVLTRGGSSEDDDDVILVTVCLSKRNVLISFNRS